MIWLTWRQFRTQAAASTAALAAIAIVLAITGPELRHLLDTSGIATCGDSIDCDTVRSAFLSHYRLLRLLDPALLLLPAIIGVFWGAPLVARELDTGTHRLAWTQSVTRTRWLATKLAILAVASMASAGLLSLMLTWWSKPIDHVNANKFSGAVFNERGITPIGYAAFAFALGVTAGLVIRRTLPAMAATFAVYAGLQIVIINWVRPHFRAALHYSGALQPPGQGGFRPGGAVIKAGDWIISAHIQDPSGHVSNRINIGPDSSCLATRTCLAGYREVVTYQPASRYWPFQWYETAIYFSLAVILAGFCFWLIRRRRS